MCRRFVRSQGRHLLGASMRTCPFEAERNKFPLQGVRDLTWGRRAASSARTTSGGRYVAAPSGLRPVAISRMIDATPRRVSPGPRSGRRERARKADHRTASASEVGWRESRSDS